MKIVWGDSESRKSEGRKSDEGSPGDKVRGKNSEKVKSEKRK